MRVGLLLVLAALVGCSRSHYREAADREAYPILGERIVSPAFDIGRTRVEPAPGSRLADPFDPDHPPKPPDDFSASLFMQKPDGRHGSHKWGKDGNTHLIEGPGWEECLGLEPNGTLKLTQDKAVDIALLNSREYQNALEGVYLAALALTLNRFEFDIRWFLRRNTSFVYGEADNSSTLSSTTNFGFTRTFAAGGQLVADFANALVYEFGGGSQSVRSNLLFTFTQPLLRNAGRQVRLESLTQAERDVLYAVRDFARFRKQFWAQTAVQNGGYLDLLLTLQTLRNTRENLKQQEESYRLTSELFRGGRASVVEFDQSYRGLLSARLAIINAENSLQTALDSYKLRLGLPPRLPVELDDSLLDQFVLSDPLVDKVRDDLDTFQRERLKELDAVPTVDSLLASFAALKQLAERAPAVVASAEVDLTRWKKRLDEPATSGDPELQDRARAAYAELVKLLPDVSAELVKRTALIETHRKAVAEANRKESWEALTDDVKRLLAAIDTATAAQTQARIYLIELPVVEALEADTMQFAKENRLDLMNQLGAVTDAWRRVTIAANALKGDVNLVASANLGTDPNHQGPFNFAAESGQYSLALQVDGPLNRLAERNAYRASLIAYQRAKRAYVALSDRIEFDIRNDLRQLSVQRTSFEIARQSVLSAARQYENARLALIGPRERRSANDSATINVLDSLAALLRARNDLAASYINYEQQRVQLLLDSEALQLDQRGLPTDVGRPLPTPRRGPAPPGPGPAPNAPPPSQ